MTIEAQGCELCLERECCDGVGIRMPRIVNGFVVYECEHCDPR